MGSCLTREETKTIKLESSPNNEEIKSGTKTEETKLESSSKIEEEIESGTKIAEETKLESSPKNEEEMKLKGTEWLYLPFEMRQNIIDFMNLETRARLAKCSKDCCDEVMLSRDFADGIEIMSFGEKGEGEDRRISITLDTEGDEEWSFDITEVAAGICQVKWVMSGQIISMTTFENHDLMDVVLIYFNYILQKNSRSLSTIDIDIDDFPYDRTNMNNLKTRNPVELTLLTNKNGIDPISSGFVDFEHLSRFQSVFEIPNIRLEDLSKIKCRFQSYTNPMFMLNEFDDFLRRCLVEEEFDENVKEIEFNKKAFEIYETKSEEFRDMIEKYMDVRRVRLRNDGRLKYVQFVRESKAKRKYVLTLEKHSFKLRISRISE
ncbi:unnamed protein product [Caenorhabditis angaria]|uniref:F-box domain-containing protein n=1 Tax=Caenorhabditis angaria TaxID=860376 RepID=A0A9P1MXK7_9PELO|nr:unnamed protein product [Caenorhabditis angaria]